MKQEKQLRFKPLLWLYLASRKRERRIITASHVLCFSCIWMVLNFPWMTFTMRSISLGEIGLVRLCSLSRFMTWVVNSLQAWKHTHLYPQTGEYTQVHFPDMNLNPNSCREASMFQLYSIYSQENSNTEKRDICYLQLDVQALDLHLTSATLTSLFNWI